MPHDYQDQFHMLYMRVAQSDVLLLGKTSRMDRWTKFIPQRQCVYVHDPVLALLRYLMGNQWKI